MKSSRPFIFLGSGIELILPVTPASYQLSKGVNMEVVNIHELGDVLLSGYGTLATIKISCLLPLRPYSFSRGGSPDLYLEQFHQWVEDQTSVRWIVGNTRVNLPVKFQDVSQGEEDGTGDITAHLTLREYRNLEVAQTQRTATGNRRREETVKASTSSAATHTIQPGDTLSAICRAHYGSGTPEVYEKLARANGIPNPHLIPLGTVLNLPRPLT